MTTIAHGVEPAALGHRGPAQEAPHGPPNRGARLATASLVVARRSLLKFLRTPQLVVLGTVQGAMFLLIFRYVFGGAITSGGLSYVDFLVPGFVTTAVLFVGTGAAAGMAEDLAAGFIDRLRSLPLPRAAVLAGRVLSDTAQVTWSLAITAAIGFGVGFRLHAPLPDALLAFGLCVVFGFAFNWVFMLLGLVAGSAQAAQGLSLMVFPLTFVSSAYVPASTMPGWLRAIATHQPITQMVDAVRALTEGHPAVTLLGHDASYFVLWSLVWAAGIVVLVAPLAIVRYRRG
jgi:ABC-2 type transport system permease protein